MSEGTAAPWWRLRQPRIALLPTPPRPDITTAAAAGAALGQLEAAGALVAGPAPETAASPVVAPQRGPQQQLPRDGRRPGPDGQVPPRWPLLAVLAAQAALSLRLVWSSTAFQDEALYLRAGHLEWARWLHHAPIPRFPGYFSGAPVLYPPLGAVADSIGGLAAARVLSLLFMLGVTGLLWATAFRLYGRRAALLAAGLFATLAGTQFLGAFATFDAMALFLLALAAWLGVRSASGPARARTALIIASGAALAAADAVKYATVLFTPVVLVVVALTVARRRGGRAGLAAGLTGLGSWLVVIAGAIMAGGREYWLGITSAILARRPSGVPVPVILHFAYVWTSLVLVLAVLGILLASRFEARGKLLPAVLAAAGFLAPAAQARLHTMVSLQKNVVFGAWFAAIAAGYAMARLSRVDPGHGWAAVMALPIVASTLFASMGQAASLAAAWPSSAALINVLRSDVRSHPGHYLAEDDDIEAYYLRSQVAWQRWSDAYRASSPQVPGGAGPYAAAIGRHYFSLVILGPGDSAAVSQQIAAELYRAGGYHVLAHAGRYAIWAATPPASSRPAGRAHARL